MKNMSKVFGVIAAIALIGFVFTACENPASGGGEGPKSYTVTFDANGGSEVAAKTVKEGGTIAELPTSTLSGSAFIGWFTDKDVWNDEFTSSTIVNGNITVFAKWDALPSDTYTITYHLNGGINDAGNPSSYTEESETITLKVPSKAGFSFIGWFDNAEFNSNAITSIPKGSTGNKNLYANWTELPPDTYTITYHLNGGINDAGNPSSYTEETATITLKEPAKEFCVFNGWFDNAEFNGDAVLNIEQGSTENKTLYAKWLIDLITPVAFEDLEDFLAILSDSEVVNSAAEPTTIKLAPINISDVWLEMNTIVQTAQRYINLDLSDCTATGNTIASTFNPIGNELNVNIKNNEYIKGFVLPSTLETIGSNAFSGCTFLTSIIIPDGVISIGENAFHNTSMSSLFIPNSLTSIGGSAFWYCLNLTDINVGNANTAYTSEDGVVFNKAKTTLVIYPVGKSETSYTVPNTVTSLGSASFFGARASGRDSSLPLTTIIIPDSVTKIRYNTLAEMTNLTSITIGSNVTIDAAGNSNPLPFRTVYNDGGKVGGTYMKSEGVWVKM